MRFGVPPVMPLERWKCDCTAASVRRDAAFRHAAEGNEGEHLRGVAFINQPLHGLCCRRRGKRIMRRHDNIRDAMIRTFNKVKGVSATEEPNVADPAHPQRRADIRVRKGGNIWLLDVGITCPATTRSVTTLKTHLKPGAAGEAYHAKKAIKYAATDRYVPFIIETGGRLHDVARDFIDELVDEGEQENRGAKRRIFRTITGTLERIQRYMMARIVTEIAPRVRRGRRR